jgi:hypothetical protein
MAGDDAPRARDTPDSGDTTRAQWSSAPAHTPDRSHGRWRERWSWGGFLLRLLGMPAHPEAVVLRTVEVLRRDGHSLDDALAQPQRG